MIFQVFGAVVGAISNRARPPDEGALRYPELRAQWQPCVVAFARYMAHDWEQIAPADQQEQ